jgi:hypothetical protein
LTTRTRSHQQPQQDQADGPSTNELRRKP